LPAIKTSWFTIPRLWLFRENELTMKYLGSNFLTISHDSFLPDWLDYNALAPFGTMYLISIPLVILGMIKSGRQVLKCSCSNEAIMWLFYGSVFGVGLFITGPNINKMNGLYLPLAFFLVSGIKQLLEITTSKKAVLILVVIIYGAQFVQFTHYYFVRYPQEIYPQSFFADTFEPGFAWVAREYPGRTVYFAENYIYCLLGTRADAREIDWHEVINQGHYRHYRFALPAQPTNEQGVYLVRETNARYLALLKNAGLQLVYTTGMYQVWAKTGD
jgi:hypothetical protein